MPIREETAGEYEVALRLYCETAYMDRTAGFHNLARDQLLRAKELVDGCPGLDLSRLYFKNNRDRDFVCGPVPPVLSRGGVAAEAAVHCVAQGVVEVPVVQERAGAGPYIVERPFGRGAFRHGFFGAGRSLELLVGIG